MGAKRKRSAVTEISKSVKMVIRIVNKLDRIRNARISMSRIEFVL